VRSDSEWAARVWVRSRVSAVDPNPEALGLTPSPPHPLCVTAAAGRLAGGEGAGAAACRVPRGRSEAPVGPRPRGPRPSHPDDGSQSSTFGEIFGKRQNETNSYGSAVS